MPLSASTPARPSRSASCGRQGEAARDPDAGDRAEQQPRRRVQVDVALHEVADAADPEQRGGVEDVGADDLRDRY